MNLFEQLDKFFLSITGYLSFNQVFLISLALFIVAALLVLFATGKTYESKLIKTIDKFNNYFSSEPQITEDNLLRFNGMMKLGYVPKQLRKQWQQFVLYRDKTASEYMSVETCVSSPLKNSGYKRAIKVLNYISYIIIALSTLLNVYCMYKNMSDLGVFFQRVLLAPIVVLILNFLVSIFLESRYNSIVSDIYSNYQYFLTNMDKATTTIPDYVDYEVLFDRNEIKRGIPILYAYLQRRAEEEKKELDRARLKNIEHEKFNFDEAGIESSLVLERAMKEAEDYIAERKKYLQDVEQINGEITQEELNYREATKEYQRQMQVSKESFANFKEQLEQVASSIEANYLKKQQQQELDRQRNLERDYDAVSDNHKRVLENLQNELTNLENDIKQSRTTLERGMMSEFSAYSNKVYDAAKALVDQREEAQKQKLKQTIKDLEEKLVAKDKEINNIYEQNQKLNSQILSSGENTNLAELGKVANSKNKKKAEEPVQEKQPEPVKQLEPVFEEPSNVAKQEAEPAVEKKPSLTKKEEPQAVEEFSFNYYDDDDSSFKVNANDATEINYTPVKENSKPVEEKAPETETLDFDFVENLNAEDSKPEESKPIVRKIPKSPGRPKKQVEKKAKEEVKGRGRPKKESSSKVAEIKPVASKGRGRPKKEETSKSVTTATKGRGRPKKEEPAKATAVKPSVSNGRGRPKKEEKPAVAPKTSPIKPATQKSASNNLVSKGRGRPRKTAQTGEFDLDAFLDEINQQIAAENAKMEQTQKELEKNSKIKRRK